MNLSDWIIPSTIIITIVPLLKMAKEKRFGGYNISIVVIGILILILSIIKNHRDDELLTKKERSNFIADSSNKAEIKKLTHRSEKSERLLAKIDISLNSIGLKINKDSASLSVFNSQKLKNFILTTKTGNNVSSFNQQGGQTAGSITNNH